MVKAIDKLKAPWRALARTDWRFFLGATLAVSMIGPATVLLPLWRDVILGSVAAVLLVLVGVERARARWRLNRLALQLKAIGSLEKLEVADDPAVGMLDKALNEAIQRTREQARLVQLSRQPVPTSEALRLLNDDDGAPRNVAVLALGLRDQDHLSVSPETMEHLREIAGTVVEVAERRSALLQMHGSGTFALIFAAFSQQPAAISAEAAFDAAMELMLEHPGLHFGLSTGTGLSCTLPGAGYTVIGSPLEEAIRLHRLAATWHEYRMLCPEPVALLLRTRVAGHRTPLQLTAPNAPAMPVYSLDLAPGVIALGA